MTRTIRAAATAGAALAFLAGCQDSTLPSTEQATAPRSPSFAMSAGSPVALSFFDGGNSASAEGVNNLGTVVGVAKDATGVLHAVAWARPDSAVKLDAFAINTGSYYCTGQSEAQGVNDAGHAVGSSSQTSCGNVLGYSTQATLWTAPGVQQLLGTLGGTSSRAWDINNKGHVVGRAATASGALHAFRWTAAAGMQDLGVLPGGTESLALAVNDAGVVVGKVGGPHDGRAVLWSASGAIQDLGAGIGSVAYDINDQGQIVGQMTTVNGSVHGFVWTAADGLVDLGRGPARGNNNAGVVVGDQWAWTQESGFVALAGFYGPTANDIGDDGTVVGYDSNLAVMWKLSGMPVTAPAAPASPSAVAGYSPTRVTLSWTDGSFNETSFAIRRRTQNADGTWGAYVVLRQAAANVTSIADSTVVLNTTYQYRVSACNSAGCSASVASGYVSPVTLPTAPTNLVAAAVTGTRINVTWTDAANNESKYPVRRREKNPDGTWTQYVKLADRPANSTSYTDTTAAAGKTYMYNVNVCNAVGCVAGPVSAEVTTPTIPAAPAGVAAAAVSATQVNVSWTDQSGNETAFKLWRRVSTGDGTWGAYVALPDAAANATSSVDNSMPAGATYQYRVRACNAAGCSAGANSPAVAVPAS